MSKRPESVPPAKRVDPDNHPDDLLIIAALRETDALRASFEQDGKAGSR